MSDSGRPSSHPLTTDTVLLSFSVTACFPRGGVFRNPAAPARANLMQSSNKAGRCFPASLEWSVKGTRRLLLDRHAWMPSGSHIRRNVEFCLDFLYLCPRSWSALAACSDNADNCAWCVPSCPGAPVCADRQVQRGWLTLFLSFVIHVWRFVRHMS